MKYVKNKPEKFGTPRISKVTPKLIGMLNTLPKINQRIFGKNPAEFRKSSFYQTRKVITQKLQNPRLKRISFHTLRHWKATTEYHKTKDILHVMRVLGHKNITNTLRYTQLIQTTDDDFITKVAKTVEEACKLIEAGYEYVTEFQDQGVKIFRKRK